MGDLGLSERSLGIWSWPIRIEKTTVNGGGKHVSGECAESGEWSIGMGS